MTTSQQRPMGRHHATDPTSVPQQRPEPGIAPPQPQYGYPQAQYGYAPQQAAAPYGAPRFDGPQYPAQPYGAPQPVYAGGPAQHYGPGQFAAPAAGQPSVATQQVQAPQPAAATAPAAPHGTVPPATPSTPPKKRRKWPFVVAGILLLLLIVGLANGGAAPTTPTAPTAPAAVPAAAPAAAPAPAEVPAAQAPAASAGKDVITYEVTGPSKAGNVTYVKDSNLGQEQVNGTKLPWSKTVEFDSGAFSIQPLSLVAQSDSGGSGEIKCRILRNGEELTSSTSSGPYAVVTCSAS